MSRIKLSPQEADIRYSNWIATLIDLIKPANLYLFGGRGVAKSTDILAKRSVDIIYDMPRACFAFVSDTYVNLMTNIVPAILLGWEERQKFFENYHYVVDKQPPDHWKKPLIKTFDYKHTITTFNGCKFFLKSLDRPSANAGISVVHIFGDEAKYLKEQKLNKAFPTLRGDYALYNHSHYFMGQTFCSDLPDPATGEDPWMLRMEKKMNKENILLILQAAMILNEINQELLQAEMTGDPSAVKSIQIKLDRWNNRLRKIRQDSTFFYIVSSFANVDILTLKYIENLLQTLEFEEFKTVVLSIKKTLEKGVMFYGNLSEKHFYSDGYNYDYYDRFSIHDNITQTSAGLRYIQATKPLEAGFDAGNMMSLVFGQEQGNEYRILKNMYTLTPDWIRELGDKFLQFFQSHNYKVLELYYDRAANQYKKAGRDFASQLKDAIEKDRNGKHTGWSVRLKSLGQGNIAHEAEYDLMNQMLGEKNPKLPKLLIDKFECKELKSQMELTPMEKDSKGRIRKIKTSDRFPLARLPMESTNFTDALKYLLCRQKYLNIARMKHSVASTEISIRT